MFAGTISADCTRTLRALGRILSFDTEDSSVVDLGLGLFINCKMDVIFSFLYGRNFLIIWILRKRKRKMKMKNSYQEFA